jgi:hypothetical protein
LKEVYNVALLKFEGPYGETVYRHLHNRLIEMQHFNPMDTIQCPSLAEASFDSLGKADLLNMFRSLGADVVLGSQVTADLDDIHGTDQVAVKEGTGYYKKEKNVHGQWVDVEIKRTVIRPLPYVIRQASMSTDFRVLDVKTNRIVATGQIKEDFKEKIGGNKSFASADHKIDEIPSPEATLDALSAKVANQIVEKLSKIKTADMVELDNY